MLYESRCVCVRACVCVFVCDIGADVRQRLLSSESSTLKDDGDMVKTIAIAVCSAVAYLAIIVGLTVYCSIRLVRAAALRKHPPRDVAVHGTSSVDSVCTSQEGLVGLLRHWFIMPPPLIGGGIKRCFCLTSA